MTTEKLDLKKAFPEYYRAPRKPVLVNLPPARFITFAGAGAPASEEFQTAVAALYTLAYTLKFACKYADNDFVVPALETFWWFGNSESSAKGSSVRTSDDISTWSWKAMIRMPEFVTERMVEDARRQIHEKKNLDSVFQAKVETIEEGTSVQMLHVGPYNREEATVAQLMEFIEEAGMEAVVRPGISSHHEIYLSDPRRVAEAKLRTIVRIPVRTTAQESESALV